MVETVVIGGPTSAEEKNASRGQYRRLKVGPCESAVRPADKIPITRWGIFNQSGDNCFQSYVNLNQDNTKVPLTIALSLLKKYIYIYFF